MKNYIDMEKAFDIGKRNNQLKVFKNYVYNQKKV